MTITVSLSTRGVYFLRQSVAYSDLAGALEIFLTKTFRIEGVLTIGASRRGFRARLFRTN